MASQKQTTPKAARRKPLRVAEDDKDYDRDAQYDSLIAFLFPEAWEVLSGHSKDG